MSLSAGRTLSHYRLVEPIGEGGMGVVWKAHDTSLGRDVAVKILPATFAADPERMARFEREARLLASLNHPNIAAIYGVGLVDGVRFLAMELVEGEDLAQRLMRGPMGVAETVEMGRDLAGALEAAHEKGIIHRDLKPANIKMNADDQVKVLDFGLAKALDAEASPGSASSMSMSPTLTSPMTAANVILGTAAYMSPEQARGKVVDRRADIWAFGCVLYECLTARRPFPGETVSDTIAKILERDPDWSLLPAATPVRLRDLLRRCFEKDARKRLRDIGDARIELDEILAARTPSGTLSPADVTGAAAPARRRSFVPMALVGLAGLIVGAALWGALAPRRGAGTRANQEPRCLSVAMPAGVRVDFDNYHLTADGRTLVVQGRPRNPDGTVSAASRVYVRGLDGYEYQELPGTEGVLYSVASPDGRSLYFLAPSAPGSPRLRLSRLPLDGSAPPTTISEWKGGWNWMAPQENGDVIVGDSPTSFIRLSKDGGAPSAPVPIECGRPGVSRYQPPGGLLPDGRGMFINVVLYDARGWHYSLGVMNFADGKVAIIDEDGGNGVYLPSSGYLVFSRGNTILGVPFDPERLAMRGAPTAVWSGLASFATYVPAAFDLTNDGDLFYRPGQLGGDRSIVLIDGGGRSTPWSTVPHGMNFAPILSPDGSRIATQFISARGIDEIWVSSVSRDDFHRIGTESGADSFFPVWSPDGRRIAYRRKGSDDKDGLYVIGVDGGEMTRILPEDPGPDYYDSNSWLPDGSGLLLTQVVQGRTSIALLPYSGGQWGSPRSILAGEFRNELPMISPDCRTLAFQSDESGKLQSYVIAFRGQGVVGRAIPIRTTGSLWHQWATDGTALYVHDERNRLMKVAITTGSELAVSVPQEVCDLDKQHVNSVMWAALPGGSLFVGLKNANEEEATSGNLVLGWSRVLTAGPKTSR